MSSYFTAKEARLISDPKRLILINAQVKSILDSIKENAQLGDIALSVITLYPESIKQLKVLGYKVSYGYDCYYIKW